MRKTLTAAFAAIIVGLALVWMQPPAGAWLVQAPKPAAAPPAYTGPADVIASPFACWSLRACSAAFATGSNNAIEITRASDSTTHNIVILTNGNLDIATAVSFAGTDATCTGTIATTTLTITSCASGTLHVWDTITGTGINQPAFITSIGTCASPPGTCTLNASQTVSSGETITAQVSMQVTYYYDQSGNTNCTTACTIWSQYQPAYLIPNAFGSLPGVFSSSSAANGVSPTLSTGISQPFSGTVVLEGVSPGSSQPLSNSTNNIFLGYLNNTTAIISANGAFTAAMSNNTLHALSGVWSSSAGTLNVDGSATSGTTGTQAFTTSDQFDFFGAGAAVFNGYWTEAAVWTGDQSAHFGALCHNQRLYWGSTGSC